MSEQVWRSEFTVPPDDRDGMEGVKYEDGGQAAIMYGPVLSEPVQVSGDDGAFFVRLHSWDENPDQAKSHRLFRSLLGKRVRVTVEVLP